MTTYEQWIWDCIAWHEMRVEQTAGRLRRKNQAAIENFKRLLGPSKQVRVRSAGLPFYAMAA